MCVCVCVSVCVCVCVCVCVSICVSCVPALLGETGGVDGGVGQREVDVARQGPLVLVLVQQAGQELRREGDQKCLHTALGHRH